VSIGTPPHALAAWLMPLLALLPACGVSAVAPIDGGTPFDGSTADVPVTTDGGTRDLPIGTLDGTTPPPDRALTADGGPTGDPDGSVQRDGGPTADTGPPPFDGGADLPPVTSGGPGPWPTARLTIYGAEHGLQEVDVADASPDEAQHIWLATRTAVYRLAPGETRFHRYTGNDGLHLSNAEPPGIIAATGGAPGEAFVGYAGTEVVDPQHDPTLHRGKFDRVRLKADGTLQVDFYDVHNNDVVGYDSHGNIDPNQTDWSYNEDRSVFRFLYDHQYHPGTLYVGFNHGVARVDAGHIDPAIGFDYADHRHVEVLDSSGTAWMGEWYGLALDPSPRKDRNNDMVHGMLWMGGKWSGGALAWTPGLYEWVRQETNPFWAAFSDPPIFQVPNGEAIHVMAVAVLGDGRIYFATGAGDSDNARPKGIARVVIGTSIIYLDPVADLGLPGANIVDMVRLPDDTLLIALADGSLWHWKPDPEPRGQLLGRIDGLPGSEIHRLYVDTTVKPAAIYVSTDAGLAVLRM
jgi:hypothetical protein